MNVHFHCDGGFCLFVCVLLAFLFVWDFLLVFWFLLGFFWGFFVFFWGGSGGQGTGAGSNCILYKSDLLSCLM